GPGAHRRRKLRRPDGNRRRSQGPRHPRPDRQNRRATVNRFLLVRLGALGDIVHAIPVAAALRRAFPASRIDWLVSARHREILDLVPIIDRRLVINDRTGMRGTVDPATSPLAAIRELRRARYDVA